MMEVEKISKTYNINHISVFLLNPERPNCLQLVAAKPSAPRKITLI